LGKILDWSQRTVLWFVFVEKKKDLWFVCILLKEMSTNCNLNGEEEQK
jgi:hypothetical protein